MVLKLCPWYGSIVFEKNDMRYSLLLVGDCHRIEEWSEKIVTLLRTV